MPNAQRIAKITLDEKTVVRRNADIEHERAVAIFDLLEENSFVPVAGYPGPYHLDLGIEDNRLILDIRGTDDVSHERIALSLTPFRDRKSTRLNSSHDQISYAVFCLKKKKSMRRQGSFWAPTKAPRRR